MPGQQPPTTRFLAAVPNWGQNPGGVSPICRQRRRYADGMVSPNTPILMLIGTIAASLLGIALWIIILWAIIRGAVLSALRKHHSEVHGPVGEFYQGD